MPVSDCFFFAFFPAHPDLSSYQKGKVVWIFLLNKYVLFPFEYFLYILLLFSPSSFIFL